MTFLRAEVDQCPESEKDFNIEVIPTVLLMKNNEILEQFIGQKCFEHINAKLDELFNKKQ